MKPDLDRSTVLKILESAFYRCAELDYRNAHIHNEEDVRSATYRYARNALDLASNWRILVNPSASLVSTGVKNHCKPDFVVFHWPDTQSYPSVEIFLEIKHWPNEDKIERDLKKLQKIKSEFSEDSPTIAFFAIVGHGFNKQSAESLRIKMIDKYQALVWLVPHWSDEWQPDGALYQGPFWDNVGLDPWRARLKHKKTNG
ncbi:MAG: hypothetical protein EA366_10230 [Spirulina sp. DLM2.Bin59]|nr:MAG: hypothetical protein EA366_10230 [Spirulina sp. DLM2.Bin59]